MLEIKTIEVVGFASAFRSLRLPFGKETRSAIDSCSFMLTKRNVRGEYSVVVNEDDLKLMSTLIQRGDEHAKPVRGILAYADIEAPIHFFVEEETYRTGHERLFSGSTMNSEGKQLKGLALQQELEKVSFARQIRKIDYFSYQTLRRMVMQRYNHRKIEWHQLIEWVKKLPLSDELILVGLEKQLEVHDIFFEEYKKEYFAYLEQNQ